MSDTNALNENVQQAKEDAVNSFGQLKDDAVRVAKSAADLGRSGVEQVKSKIADGKAAVQTKISDGTETLKSKISDGTETVRSKLSDGTDAAREYADRARERGNDLLGQLQTQIEQNPLQAIGIAAGVGVLVGVLLRRR
jgi:ElaB/YqjD/DUF883 family membrane-anchored ribosome-binding protein